MPEAESQAQRAGGSRGSPREQQQPSSAAASYMSPPTKKLPQEDIDKSVARLYSSQRKTRDLPPLLPKKTISKEAEEASIRRMYEQAVVQHKNKLEEAERKMIDRAGLVESKKMEEPELTDAVQRLYLKAMEIKKLDMQKLQERYAQAPASQRLSKDQQTSVCDRVYSVARAKSSESKQRLFSKYVLDVLPKVPKRTDEQWKQTSDRLYVKK